MQLGFGSCFFISLAYTDESEMLSLISISSLPASRILYGYWLLVKELSHRSQRVFSEAGCRIGLKEGTQLGRNGKWRLGIMRQHLHSSLKKLMFSQFKFRTLSVSGGGFINLLINSYVYSSLFTKHLIQLARQYSWSWSCVVSKNQYNSYLLSSL